MKPESKIKGKIAKEGIINKVEMHSGTANKKQASLLNSNSSQNTEYK